MQASVLGHIAENDGFFGPDVAAGLEAHCASLGKDAS